MYGTCETLCRELAAKYPGDAPLMLVIWSPEEIQALADGMEISLTDHEIRTVLARMEDIPEDQRTESGISSAAVRKSPPAPLYPAMRAWPYGFSVMWPQRRVRAVPCLHLSRAGVDARVRFAAAVTRSLLPVCRDFPVVHPLRFRGLTLQLPSAVCVRLRLPLRPCIPACSPGFYGGTAPPGVAEYVNNGGKHHAICETCHSEC